MKLIDHAMVMPDGSFVPQAPTGQLYNYFWTEHGVYLRAIREHLSVCYKTANVQTRGLGTMFESFELYLPRVPVALVEQMLIAARTWAIADLEQVYHLCWEDDGWQLIIPPQHQTPTTCRPLEDGPESSHHRALIEIHSHHEMAARFSRQDNADETGFRIYGVLGTVLSNPEIRMRVGVYGQFFPLPAHAVLEMPDGLDLAR